MWDDSKFVFDYFHSWHTQRIHVHVHERNNFSSNFKYTSIGFIHVCHNDCEYSMSSVVFGIANASRMETDTPIS